jgi:hypothetical protein
MDTDTQIAPALTAEEWALRQFYRRERPQRDPHFVCVDDEGLRVESEEPIGPQNRHALAALALHDQPFGFTREMVAALEYQTFGTRRYDLLRGKSMAEIAAIAGQAIERLVALLPPE